MEAERSKKGASQQGAVSTDAARSGSRYRWPMRLRALGVGAGVGWWLVTIRRCVMNRARGNLAGGLSGKVRGLVSQA